MTTLFPGAIDSYTTKVDGVDDVMAAHVNDLQDAVVAIETDLIAKSPNPNLLIHTLSHDIWQRGTTFNDFSDDTYGPDTWCMLHNGQAPDVAGVAATGDFIDVPRFFRVTFDSANSQAGIVQFLEYQDTLALRGKTLSFSFDAFGFNVTKVRAAILGWTGTGDNITSDVVATWQAGNPVLAANWTYLSEGFTPTDKTLSGLTRVKIEGVDIPAGAPFYNNLAVFIWTPELESSTDALSIARAKLEVGLTATNFVANSFAQELARCQRYCYAIEPGAVSKLTLGMRIATAFVTGYYYPQVPLKGKPTALSHNITGWTNGAPGTTTVAAINYVTGGYVTITGALTVSDGSDSGFILKLNLQAGTSFNGTAGDFCEFIVGPDVRIQWTCDL